MGDSILPPGRKWDVDNVYKEEENRLAEKRTNLNI
jgi:hypothetical protein